MVESGIERIRVLIVDDIPETRENVRKLLFFEKDIEVVATASTGKEAIGLSIELHPAVVLMDINMPDMDGIAATKSLLEKAPGTQVIMMSVQGEMSYVRESMRAGAREFLIKPFSSDELVTSIRRVNELRSLVAIAPPGSSQRTDSRGADGKPAPSGKIIAVFSAKGGAGCSTVATNLACALKADSANNRVALWDTSFQFGDVGVMLNIQPSHSIVDVLQQIGDLDEDVLNGAMLSHSSGIRVLLAPPEPQTADSIRTEDLESIIVALRHLYDFIVIDTWTSLYDQVLTLLDAADRIIVLLPPEIAAVKNTRLFFDIAERLGYSSDKIMLVLSKWDRRSGIRPERLEAVFNHRVDGIIPVDERTVPLSVNQGLPFVLSYKATPISQSIIELTKRLIEALQPEPAPAPPVVADSSRAQASRLSHLRR